MSTTGREHKFRVIKGVLPRKSEIIDWSEAKLISLLEFAQFFIEGDKFTVTREQISKFQERATETDWWMEFNVRIDHQTNRADFKTRTFQMRLMTFIRTVLSYLKSNPHAISNEMREIMEKSARLSWALDPFKMVTTKMGAEIIKVDDRETTDPNVANVSPGQSGLTLPEVQYHNAILLMTSMLNDVLKSVKKDDIKKISASERIKIANALAQTLAKTFNSGKPNTLIFKQLNVNKAGKDDLERAFLDMAQQQ